MPNSECSHGTRQLVSGYGVEKTSRQPVALTVTIRPPVARMAASSTYRAPSASPQPRHARCPDVRALLRSSRDWPLRRSGSRSRFPTAQLPTW
ncbi:hypothetical protein N866_13125 [Actinotalea ferrariae CF5-4]|uniref:Uncharacterized protein n=1 Tax=Actinotalea ferrariae CF5-4 TaxID=948458 RepID=A0A021VVJ9_9CELL|nr:hypothetical protein N866_13125 [Actinotalea ferrariae CF5-4]